MRFARSFVTIFIILYTSFLVAGDRPSVEQVTNKLSCYCGGCPHLPVNACGCPEADKIKKDVGKKLASGMTEQQIIDGYVAQYGQTVLSMPPKSGFNLTAWLIPFLGFALGGTVLIVFLKRQKTDGSGDDDQPKPPSPDLDPSDEYYREQLRKEMEKQK